MAVKVAMPPGTGAAATGDGRGARAAFLSPPGGGSRGALAAFLLPPGEAAHFRPARLAGIPLQAESPPPAAALNKDLAIQGHPREVPAQGPEAPVDKVAVLKPIIVNLESVILKNQTEPYKCEPPLDQGEAAQARTPAVTAPHFGVEASREPEVRQTRAHENVEEIVDNVMELTEDRDDNHHQRRDQRRHECDAGAPPAMRGTSGCPARRRTPARETEKEFVQNPKAITIVEPQHDP